MHMHTVSLFRDLNNWCVKILQSDEAELDAGCVDESMSFMRLLETVPARKLLELQQVTHSFQSHNIENFQQKSAQVCSNLINYVGQTAVVKCNRAVNTWHAYKTGPPKEANHIFWTQISDFGSGKMYHHGSINHLGHISSHVAQEAGSLHLPDVGICRESDCVAFLPIEENTLVSPLFIK